jgi:IS605 OrfB family transposase
MQCRIITIENVDFTSHKGLAEAALKGAFGKQPVTMRVLSRRQDDGSVAWHVHASVDVPTGFAPATARSREAGVLGLDLNARGVAWCVAKPDGNRLVKDCKAQRGFVPWDLKDKSDKERKQIIGTAVLQLVEKAQQLGVAVAIENLDFATKKLTMRAGAVNKSYNEMLSSLASSQFAEMMARACEKRWVKLYLVNPSYSSVGGYAKYGRLNRCNADEGAALWLARQALYGSVWKTDGACSYVRKHDEKLVFPYLPVTRMQSMKALAGVQWKDVSRGLGKNRKEWGAKLQEWFLCQVETASKPSLGEPDTEIWPAGTKRGFQPGTTSALGDADFALVALTG